MSGKSYGLEQYHAQLKEIMVFIHDFCVKNDIKYSLTGGSLLGAIRHQGFIPWDDDFDIMLDRENYEKLIACMKAQPTEGFILEPDQWVYRVRKQHKVKGFVPSIDLFVLDKTPESKFKNKLQVLYLRVLQGMLRDNEKKGDFSLFYRLCILGTSFLGLFFKKEKLFARYDKVSRMGNAGAGEELSIFNDRFHLLSLRYSRDLMADVELHDFEDTQFYIISRYDEYLSLQFGDYMTPPPEEQRIPQHII